jgi:hypothetical protein
VTARPVLRSVSPDASAEEVAAVVAALALCTRPGVAVEAAAGDPLDAWVRGSRLGARRAPLQRGPWRLSGRISRRSMA